MRHSIDSKNVFEELFFEEEISVENAMESDLSDVEEGNLDEDFFIPPNDHSTFDFREETEETFRNRTKNDQDRVKNDFIKIQKMYTNKLIVINFCLLNLTHLSH